MTHGPRLFRLRGGPWTNEVTGRTVNEDWDHPTVLELPDASIVQTSTSMLATATREQALESKSLFAAGSLDIRKGDRILVSRPDGPPFTAGDDEVLDANDQRIPVDPAGAEIYSVDGYPPAADVNPFTGWSPNREIPLTRSVG